MNVIKEFIKQELNYASGCTEPGAVAYAVASGAEYVRGEVKKIVIETDGFVYKNGMATGIPVVKKYRGNRIAAALGYYSINPQKKKLKVLMDVNQEKIKKAEKLFAKIEFKIVDEKTPFIRVTIFADNQVQTVIAGEHSNLLWIMDDGIVIKEFSTAESEESRNSLEEHLRNLNFEEMISLVEQNYNSDIENFLIKGLKTNQKLVEASQSGKAAGIGFKYESALSGKVGEIAALIAHGIDARMSGISLPALASSGSGDQGITISIAVYEVAIEMRKDIDEIFKATLLAHLVTYYVKLYMGKLSALCGLISAAAPGIAAAFLYLSGKEDKIEIAIKQLVGDSCGVICDGAKSTCSFKAVTAFEQAYKHYKLVMAGLDVETPVGIVDRSLEKTLDNLSKLSIPECDTINKTIVKVMDNDFGKKYEQIF